MRRIIFNMRKVALDVARSPFLWSFLVLYALYWIVAPFAPRGPVLEASSVLVLVGGLAVLFTWFASFILGVASGARIGSWQLPVAIWLTWFAVSEQRFWALLWRFTPGTAESKAWMLQDHFVGQANWLLFLSTFLYLISPGNDNGEVPVKNWYVLITAVGAAMFGAGVVVTALVLRG